MTTKVLDLRYDLGVKGQGHKYLNWIHLAKHFFIVDIIHIYYVDVDVNISNH